MRTAKQPKKIRYDWKRFAASPDLQRDYTVEVKNRFEVLEDDDNGACYEKFVEANRLAMEECVPLKPKRKSVHTSTNPQVVEAREPVEEAHNTWEEESSADNREAWRRALDEMYAVYDQVKEQELEEQTRNIEEAFGAQQYHGEAWRVMNEISGRKKAKEGQVSGNSREERVTTWFTHFKKLPSVEDPDEEIPTIFENLDINDEPFTLEEFRKVKASLKLGKAAGPDNIPPEVFKLCDFDEISLKFCNRALTENDKPDLWSFMNIIPVPKSGDLSNTNNYRGISLICIVAKIYNRLILNRIQCH